jgi:histidyl-tRNA synthetase
MAKISPPPGTADIFPDEIPLWYRLENCAQSIFSCYGYGELRTPVFEYTEVFQRGLGNETEVVQKEMYTFMDRGGRSLTLRPEGTAGVMRALLNTDVMNGNEKRVFYIGPMFRGEKPAAGRRRQFHQIGVENAGKIAPELDAENIAMLMHYLEEVGISGSKLLLNTRGSYDDRKPAEDALRNYFSPHIDKMCDDCKVRFDNNVWRILDCKVECCQTVINNTPDATDSFSQESKDYFKRVCELLTVMKVDFEVAPRLVRGLDYYVHTVFEVIHPGLGAQNAIAGGGRYELFLPNTKKPMIGVGFAAGLERLMMVQEALQVAPPELENKTIFLVSQSESARDFNLAQANILRHKGVAVALEVEAKSVKAQMRAANRIGAHSVIICGDSELERGLLMVKDMTNSEQHEIPVDKLLEYCQKLTT